ncbi:MULTISPECIES: elongation factor P--(R)-beta-lysine ligase [unclassified Colwellia]|uniref:elongation factor P--(R)-beta-lysine ligase n=1 Tax=unclassified Colwellia TaxID=196834 RepID=UPI0015F73462|nr:MULTISPECIES: elongation factor P--(R)-beta-lysine ligase [unclassified Colwellia]MBA6346807.1 elongation factor P--(R)-beta-lysine ligase [Colwellia sp. BRX8-9]MBA6355456.1 elongation factor P--(R)-beta-lysine ligase [Colwellia sp. BRX8-3]MBA6358802.1 elongation factor P--(R)-beta-lysine ligase [Colwellia sp. BRX8-6]MBA6367223.1 elongation factor P--(R)-beta-lysine ligase [Colwellia sp. BRX8-5]MBA6376288.1 elongation factor P--(R)-beta-lysine ligase [Colwellia sp. BRX8-2]
MKWEVAKSRGSVINEIRDFFKNKNVIEVETPSLSMGTVTDPYLDAFSTQYNYLDNSDINQSQQLYLQTSPEFHMKRLLASGYGCIFQICKAFRHEDSGRYHNPEFTLLEWYRIGFDQHDLMAEVDELLSTVVKTPKSEKISYQNLFIKFVSIDPLTATFNQLYEVIELQGKAADWLYESDDCDLLLQFIFSEIIEKNIGLSRPCFVYNFPIAQASLAKECVEDNRVAQRFECYFKSVELANGFNELTDADIQITRFEQDNSKRQQLGLVTKNIDENFIKALQSGLPQCAGVALGIDRLMMIALEKSAIEDVISFPIERA